MGEEIRTGEAPAGACAVCETVGEGRHVA
jgi:hypothetical protein